jgi:hypothetical protein
MQASRDEHEYEYEYRGAEKEYEKSPLTKAKRRTKNQEPRTKNRFPPYSTLSTDY